MRQDAYLSTLYKSLYSGQLYRNIINQWTNTGIAYLGLVSLIVALFVGAINTIKVQQFFDEYLSNEVVVDIIKQIPSFSLKDGRLTIDSDKNPYLINNQETPIIGYLATDSTEDVIDEMKYKKLWVMFYTQGFIYPNHAEYYKHYPHHYIYKTQPDHGYFSYSSQRFPRKATLDYHQAEDQQHLITSTTQMIDRIKAYLDVLILFPLSVIGLFIYAWVSNIFYAVVFGAIYLIVDRFWIRRELSYKQILCVTAVALTWSNLLFIVGQLLSLPLRNSLDISFVHNIGMIAVIVVYAYIPKLKHTDSAKTTTAK